MSKKPLTAQERSKFEKRKDIILRFFAKTIGILSAMAIILVIAFFIKKKIQLNSKIESDFLEQKYGPDGQLLPRTSDQTNSGQEISGNSTTTAELKDLDKFFPAIADVLQEFFAAQSVPELLPLVRDARRVRPLIEDYYRRYQLRSRSFKSITWAVPVDERGHRFAYAEVVFNDAPPMNVVIEQTDTGFYVDWESLVQYSEIGWEDFLKGKIAEPKTFRLLVSKAEDETLSTSETEGHWRIVLKHSSEMGEIHLSIDPLDPRYKKLIDQLELSKGEDAPITLQLQRSLTPATENAFSIVRVDGKGWLNLD